MALRTTADLIDEIRERGEISVNYVTPSAMQTWVQGSVMRFVNHFAKTQGGRDMLTKQGTNVTVASGTQFYELDSDVYLLVGVDVETSGGKWHPMKKFKWSERNAFASMASEKRFTRYRFPVGRGATGYPQLALSPVPTWSGTLRIWYVPQQADITSGSFDYINGWWEFVINDVLAKYAAKEEGDASQYILNRQEALSEMQFWAEELDDSEPERTRDLSLDDLGVEVFE